MSELRWIDASEISPSKFETRSTLDRIPSVARLGIITPPKVRPVAGGPKPYELVCGHRRTSGIVGRILCEVQDIDDKTAALLLFFDNEDSKKLSQAERGAYFDFLEKEFGWNDERLSEELGGAVAPRTIEKDRQHSLWVREMDRRSNGQPQPPDAAASLETRTEFQMPVTPFAQVTKRQQEELRKLPNEKQEIIAKAIIDEDLGQIGGLKVVAKVKQGIPIDKAIAQVTNLQEKLKEVRYHERRHAKGQKDTNPPSGVYHCQHCGDTLLIECIGPLRHNKLEEGHF